MTTGQLLLTNLGLVALCLTLLWLLSLPLRNVSIVDIFWGPGSAGLHQTHQRFLSRPTLAGELAAGSAGHIPVPRGSS